MPPKKRKEGLQPGQLHKPAPVPQWGNAANRSSMFRRLVPAAISRVSSGTQRLKSAAHVIDTRRETRLCPPPDTVGSHANDLLRLSSLGQWYNNA